MKIAFIIATLGSGGAERALISLANELCKVCAVQIIKFDDKNPFYKLNESIVVSSLKQFKFSNFYHKIASRIKKFFALRNALKSSRADIFISFLDSTNIACIAAKCGLKTPLIISEHSTQSYLKPKIWRILRRLSYPYCNALSVLSQSDKIYYEKFTPRVKVLLNPCEFSLYEDLKKENVVLFVGRLDANKNAAMFLKAIAKLPLNLQKNYEFLLAGEGILRKNLEKFAQNLGISVKFLGAISDIASLYKRAKIICLCSFVEGLPTVLVESLFFGVARISTDYENAARDLINNGTDGFLVPADDAGAMSEKMMLLMSDENLRLNLAKEAAKRCEKFSAQNIAQQWLGLINEVLENNANSKKNLCENSGENLSNFSSNSSENLENFNSNSKKNLCENSAKNSLNFNQNSKENSNKNSANSTLNLSKKAKILNDKENK